MNSLANVRASGVGMSLPHPSRETKGVKMRIWTKAFYVIMLSLNPIRSFGDTNLPGTVIPNHVYERSAQLVRKIETEFPGLSTYNSGGSLVQLQIPSKYKDAESLGLISRIGSIQKIKIWGTPSQGTPPLTREGISSLASIGDLKSLELACFQTGLRPGVIAEATRLKSLEDFKLYFANAPPSEYKYFNRMTNLLSCEIIWCENFRDEDLQDLALLPHLRKLVLIDTAVSVQGTNVLRNLNSLTNTIVKFRAK